MSEGMHTTFTRLVGCDLPIQLAVMGGGIGTPALAAAVSAAGGLGMLCSTHPMPLVEQLDHVRRHTQRPVGVGFFGFQLPAMMASLELAAESTEVIDLFWGQPDPAIVSRIHAGGALAFWQVGSLDEALAAADAGCDAVVAQGIEAGGHVRGTTPLLTLLSDVVPAVSIPVVAAGGVATGAALAAVLNAGAAAARVGTRLLMSSESGAHTEYRAALLAATGEDTVHTTAFGVDWPDAPHRVLRTAVDNAAAASDIVGQATYGAHSWDVARWSAQPPTDFVAGAITSMAMYAGSAVGDISDVPSARDAIAQMVAEAGRPDAHGRRVASSFIPGTTTPDS